MGEKKQNRIIIICLAMGIILPVAVIILITALSKYDVLVKETSGSFYRARGLFVAGNLGICVRTTASFATKKQALDSGEPATNLSFISMNQVEAIEVLIGRDEKGQVLPGWQPTLKDYIGNYTINAAGNHGYMALRASGGYIYGTIRFPEWGKGATEYLKNVKIVSGKIYFTRSATTQQEIRRLGASSYFVQYYSGEYFRSGNYIRGYYMVKEEKKSWEAAKNR
jgi:hypothetical protein